ncbi:unnamed protein product [Ascophyllum nodosum]
MARFVPRAAVHPQRVCSLMLSAVSPSLGTTRTMWESVSDAMSRQPGPLVKVLDIPWGGVADILSHYPKTCSLEAEANLAPLRHFFERELFVEDSARIGRLVCKFPRLLLFQDVETQLKPRAEEFRKALGLEGMEPVPPPVRSRPKRGNNRPGDAGLDSNGRGRVSARGARRKERSSGYLGEERGNSRSGAGYRGQNRKERSNGSGRGQAGGGRVM